MPNKHIVKAYDDELAELDRLIAEMGGRVEAALAKAAECLLTYDTDGAKEVRAEDKQIDQLEIQIDHHATRMLALRQPMAEDLRLIIACLKMSNDLERMGDYAKNIAKRTITISQAPLITALGQSIRRMAQMVEAMIHTALDAYVARDAQLAASVVHRDEEVDQLHTSIFREILTYMMEDSRNITACTHLLFVAKNIERVGDHTTNVAEQVYYLITGHQLEDARAKADKAASVNIGD